MWLWLSGAVALVLVIGLHLGVDKRNAKQLDKARTELITYRQSIADFKTAQSGNLQTIVELKIANEAWAVMFNDSVGEYDYLINKLKAELEAERVARNRAQAEAKANLNRILKDDYQAANWGIERLPNSVAQWVRDYLAAASKD